MISSSDILKAKILIVDDQPANVVLLQQILEGAGYSSIAALNDPTLVCERHRENRYDLIILDLQMPVMDGFQVLEKLKEFQVDGYLPVLVITAQPGHKLRALKAGARDFISKPFDLSEVLIRVQNLVEVRLLYQSETQLSLKRLENSQRIAVLGDFERDFIDHRLVWSEGIYRILGISREKAAPSTEAFLRLVHPDDLSRVLQEQASGLNGPGRADFEYRIIRPDGELRHLHQISEAIFDQVGRPTREAGTIQDITERKIAEETLRESERRYRGMLQGVQAGVIVHGADTHITAFNAMATELLGVNGVEMSTRTPFDRAWSRVQADGSPLADEDMPYSRACASRQAVRDVIVGVHRPSPGDLRWLLVNANPVFNSKGDIAEVVVTFMDVTTRIQAEQAVREAEAKYRLIFEHSNEGIFQTAPDGHCLSANPTLARILGFASPEELIRLRSPGDHQGYAEPAIRQKIERLLAKQEFVHGFEYQVNRRDGAKIWLSENIRTVRDSSGHVIYYEGSLQDITQRKRFEEHMRQSQKMEAVGTLAGGIAHDFNNLLAAINGYTELARIRLKENPEVRDHLSAVLIASKRAADLVKQILAFSRQQPIERKSLQLGPIVADSLKLLRATIPTTIEFETSLASNAYTILADGSQIHQILMNLGTNASHAMKGINGRLRIELKNCVVDEKEAANQPRLHPGVYACITISDTGSGMSEETLRRIFEPFFTTKPMGEGTGLGLAVVQGIVDNHDGAITVQSQLGKGTEFKLYFPAYMGEPLVAPPRESSLPRGKGERILLVDDEELLVKLGEQALTVLGYQVEGTTKPAIALSWVQADPNRFALVVTDQTMPGMTGVSLATQIQHFRPGLPVILTSGYTSALTPDIIEAAGVCKFLLKPTSFQVLGEAVHRALADVNAGGVSR